VSTLPVQDDPDAPRATRPSTVDSRQVNIATVKIATAQKFGMTCVHDGIDDDL